jgi:hypothetical protein
VPHERHGDDAGELARQPHTVVEGLETIEAELGSGFHFLWQHAANDHGHGRHTHLDGLYLAP